MTEKKQAYIAFQGGGALGMAHLGAWKALSQQMGSHSNTVRLRKKRG